MKDEDSHRVRHATITLERAYKSTPERLFSALSNAEERKTWDAPDEGWVTTELTQDVREGGAESFRFGPEGDPRFHGESTYAHVAPGRSLVTAGVMKENDVMISATIATYEILPDPMGVRLVVTDQTAYFGASDTPEEREMGWSVILDNLGAYLG
ncbi:MAG: SRPBCC domain-containing protein [Pseudomonadota bacterium]